MGTSHTYELLPCTDDVVQRPLPHVRFASSGGEWRAAVPDVVCVPRCAGRDVSRAEIRVGLGAGG